jgi:predicted RNase H-like nuclease
MSIGIIGIDCSTQAKNIGLACGVLANGNARINVVTIGESKNDIVSMIARWAIQFESVLIALDAPLGWPMEIGKVLNSHEAGKSIETEPNQLFRRSTDRFIKTKIGKQPLDVGADRIARTAHAALSLLEKIREESGDPIPLAWEPRILKGIFAIEVYPAATLIAYDINVPGYKRKDGQDARSHLMEELGRYIQLPNDVSLLEKNNNVLDAVICVLAGKDFLRGDVFIPIDIEAAQKEGWIWVKKP